MSGYRRPFTVEEERKILHYIFRKNGFYRLRGLQFWKEVSRDVLPNRTYQSLHERFRKYIINNVHNSAYDLSSKEQVKLKTIYDEMAKGKKSGAKTTQPLVTSMSNEVDHDLAKDFFDYSDSDDEDAHNATSATTSRVNSSYRQKSAKSSVNPSCGMNYNLRNKEIDSRNDDENPFFSTRGVDNNSSSSSDSEIFHLDGQIEDANTVDMKG